MKTPVLTLTRWWWRGRRGWGKGDNLRVMPRSHLSPLIPDIDIGFSLPYFTVPSHLTLLWQSAHVLPEEHPCPEA